MKKRSTTTTVTIRDGRRAPAPQHEPSGSEPLHLYYQDMPSGRLYTCELGAALLRAEPLPPNVTHIAVIQYLDAIQAALWASRESVAAKYGSVPLVACDGSWEPLAHARIVQVRALALSKADALAAGRVLRCTVQVAQW